MIRHALAATALLAATSLAAQSTTQDELDARYDHALAAGYKALFICSALSGDAARSDTSVEDYELAVIKAGKAMGLTVIDLLVESGAKGAQIADLFNAPMTVTEYITRMRGFRSDTTFKD